MRVFVASEQRFALFGGVLYVESVQHYRFWMRYLDAFDEVTIVARAKEVNRVPEGWLAASGDRVGFVPLPYFIGPTGFLRVVWRLWCITRGLTREDGAFLLRVPGNIGTMLWLHLARARKAYALEVVGDPYDSLSPQVFGSRWIYPLRLLKTYVLKKQCRAACAVAYVTRWTLQRRYPPSPGVRAVGIPTGIRVDASFASQANQRLKELPARYSRSERKRSYTIISVGTMSVLYKGQDVLIRAVASCIGAGLDVLLVLVGDGRRRSELEQLSAQLGVSSKVRFAGHLSHHEEVYSQLREADLFVLPSYQEGVPRAMLEAMACGLPCIGSTAGGIPELLPPEDMVPAGDVIALAAKIQEVLMNPRRMVEMGSRNHREAQQYAEDVLRERRTAYYRHVRELARASSADQDERTVLT